MTTATAGNAARGRDRDPGNRKAAARAREEAWAAKKAEAERLLAMNGRTVADVRRAIDGMPCPGGDPDWAAVLIAASLAGPPATDDAMREVAAILGLHYTPAPAAQPAAPIAFSDSPPRWRPE